MASNRWYLLLLMLLTPCIAAAQPSDLLISEYIEGSSNNKAIEIYNGTGSAINLATDNYVLQMYFNGSTTAGLTISLTGTVANGDVYVVAHASANATILAQADQTNGSGWFNGDDAIVLRKGGAAGTIVDAIGQVGNDPGTEWGSGLTSTADNTLRRKAAACAGDTDPGNTFDPSVDFDGFAQDNVADLGSHTASCSSGEEAPSVTGTSPANNAAGVSDDANIVITFSEDVNVTGSWFTFETSGGSAVAATVSGGPAEYTLNPDADLQEGETYTVTVIAANVSDQDSDDPPNNMESDHSFSFTVAAITPISTIQGSGSASSLVNQNVLVEGIVVGDFQENDGDYSDLDGFYIQEESEDQDTDPETSEGIFVFAPGGIDVEPGDIVRVAGRVIEFATSGSSLTELGNVTSISIRGTTSLPTPIDVEMPFPSLPYLERFEGMYVRLPQELQIAEYFNFDRFNEIVLARPLDGLDRPFTPTSYVEPGAAAQAVAAEIALNRITLDDARGTQNPDPALHPNGAIFNLTNRFRGGDIVRNATGVLEDRFGLYRIQPTEGADFIATNPRPLHHEEIGGCLKVAGANVLNYFLTLNDGSDNCGPNADMECRGANTSEEFQRQRAKILAALGEINADIFGLNELENTTGVEPLEDIVNGLNAEFGAGTYDYIETGTVGTDAIKIGIIYKTATVTPVGIYETLTTSDDPRFLDTKNRPSLAQTFRENATDEVFTVVVNHLKSKGSDCNDVGDPDLGDGAGNCNTTRTLAAQALVDWLATDPTGSDDPDYLIIGDLNSYDQEDPIDAIKAGADDIPGTDDDYVDLIEDHGGEFAYSYVFDGQLGYLDYGMATTALARRVTGATEWHINADEPDLFDYDMTFKAAAQDSLYEPLPYRTSDHDAVVLGFDFGQPVITVGAQTEKLWPANHNYHTFSLDDLEISVNDDCEDISADDVVISRVWSDEPENANGNGDGNTLNDIVIAADCRSVMVRAERNGNGNGRVYKIKLKVADESGNVGRAAYKVKVPKTRNGSATSDGSSYIVNGCDPGDALARTVPGIEIEEMDEDEVYAETGATLRLYPGEINPAEIELELSEPTALRLVLYDISGTEVACLTEGESEEGTHRISLDALNLPGGIYVAHLVTRNASAGTRIVIAR